MGQVRTFQLTKSLSLLTVLENMKLGAPHQRGEGFWSSLFPFLWRAQDTEIEGKARELLARFKLDAKEKDFAASLSGGQRKLLEMARALMSDPTLVMLDEPMAGVNPALTQSLLDHILDLKEQGMTVLFVEHDMHMVRHNRGLGDRHGRGPRRRGGTSRRGHGEPRGRGCVPRCAPGSRPGRGHRTHPGARGRRRDPTPREDRSRGGGRARSERSRLRHRGEGAPHERGIARRTHRRARLRTTSWSS